jgi:hypothetical protein
LTIFEDTRIVNYAAFCLFLETKRRSIYIFAKTDNICGCFYSFVRCLPSLKFLSGLIFWWMWLFLCFIWVKIICLMSVCEILLIERLRAQTTSAKTPVLARFLRVQASPSGRQNTRKIMFSKDLILATYYPDCI